nr:MAG TPA: hypothetical protein [Bacteriophage sp.]
MALGTPSRLHQKAIEQPFGLLNTLGTPTLLL